MIDKNTYALAIARIAKHDGDVGAHHDLRSQLEELILEQEGGTYDFGSIEDDVTASLDWGNI